MAIDSLKSSFKSPSGGPDLAWVPLVVSRSSWRPGRIDTGIPGLGVLEDAILFVDTETDGLYVHMGHKPFLIGLASTSGRWVAVETDNEVQMARVAELLANPLVLKVGHHWKFDRKHCRGMGLAVKGPEACTMLMTQMADNRLNSYALKRLAVNLLREKVDEESALKDWLRQEALRRKRNAKAYECSYVEPTFKDAPRKIVVPYLGKDLEYTAKLFFASGPVCARKCADPTQVENQLIRVVAGMEERGVWADGAYFEKTSAEAKQKLVDIEKEAHRIAGTPFELGSNKQLADVMFKKLGLTCLAYTEKGNPKFDADTLPMYDHPLVKTMLTYRKVRKLDTTYYEPLAEMALFTGGTIHSSFNQQGAKRTGRFSSSDPNLQNIPRKDKTVRAGFVCRPGFIDYYLDYSQIEMRIFAHYAEDQELIDSLMAGEDVHEETAVLLFGEEARGNEQLRFVGKTINFGIIYGMGARALRKQMRKRLLGELEHMSEDEKPSQAVIDLANISETGARLLLNKYYKIRPRAKTFIDDVQAELRRKGQIVDIFGRPYNVPLEQAYKGGNYLVQGTAAAVLKRAMIRVDKALRMNGELWTPDQSERCHMSNCVHDELKIEVPREIHSLRTMRVLRDLMEDRTSFAIPITCDVSVAELNWAKKEEACRQCVDAGGEHCHEEKCYCATKGHKILKGAA